MAKKTTGNEKAAPKAKPKAEATGAKKTAKKSTSTPKEPKKPRWIKKGVTEFVVATEDYRDLVTEANRILGTQWNPWRVRPAVFYTLWEAVRKHYGVE